MNRPGSDGQEFDKASEEDSIAALRALLRESESSLDFTTRAKLAAARARAREAASSARPRSAPGFLWGKPFAVPALLAAALVLLLVPEHRGRLGPLPPPAASNAQKIETAGLSGDPDFSDDDSDAVGVAEDLDFYQWLDETNAGA